MNRKPISALGENHFRCATVVGLFLGGMVLLLPQAAAAAPAEVTFEQSTETVDVFDFVDVTLRVAKPVGGNPFMDVLVEGEFRLGADGTPVTAGLVVRRSASPWVTCRAGLPTPSVLDRYSDTPKTGTPVATIPPTGRSLEPYSHSRQG